MDLKCLLAEYHIDKETGCLYRFIKSENEYFRWHYHDYYEIFLTMDAEISHLVNDSQQLLKEGSLVFIRPADIHTFEYDGKNNFTFVNLTFTKETIEQLFHYLSTGFPSPYMLESRLPPTVVLSTPEKKRLFAKMQELNTINWDDKKQLKLHMRTLLVEIFTRYFIDVQKKDTTAIPYWLEILCERMKKTANFMAGTERMIELSGKSREHLARSFKKHLDMTMTEYVNDLRINYFANMLKSSNIPILDLCYECGFQNISWCYTLFKKKYGISPKDFRKLKF